MKNILHVMTLTKPTRPTREIKAYINFKKLLSHCRSYNSGHSQNFNNDQ